MKNRRQFLQQLAGLSAMAVAYPAFARTQIDDCGPNPPMDSRHYIHSGTRRASKSLNILVLGGSGFLGAPLVQYANERGHQVTIFNRGITNPHLFTNLEKHRGDRLEASPYHALKKRQWDAVIDTWKGNPLVVKESAENFRPATKHYLYISSISVYGGENYKKDQITEEDYFYPSRPLPATKSQIIED